MMMTKKTTTKKLKSMTALAAFVAISFLTVTTTTVGIVAYSADHSNQSAIVRSDELVAPGLAGLLPAALSAFEGR